MKFGAITVVGSDAITFQANGSVSSSGVSSTLTLSSGGGSTSGGGGTLKLQSGNGGSTSGAGGALQLFAGAAVGTTGGAGGAVQLTAGAAAGSTGGAGGAVTLQAGAGAGTNQAGGAVTLTGGLGTGTGAPGGVTLTAANSTTGVGADVVLTAGAGSVLANDGVVQISRVPTSNRAARLRFIADNATTVDLKAPAAVTSYALTLPTAQGAASSLLQNNGSGALSWAATSSVGKLKQTLFTQITTDTTTTSTTFVAFLSQAVTIVAGSDVIVNFTCAGSQNANSRTTFFQLLIDGTPTRGTGFGQSVAANSPGSCALVYRATGLAVGAHTFAIQWRTSASTSQVRPATVINEHASLLLQEVTP